MTATKKEFKIQLILSSFASFFILTGFGSPPPKEVLLPNNAPVQTGNAPAPIRIAPAVSPNSVLAKLPPSFDCNIKAGSSEEQCMVCNCYHESRGESAKGQESVYRVVYSRQINEHFPNTVCGVITQPSQFSWYNPSAGKRSNILKVSDTSVQKCAQTLAATQKYRGTWYSSNFHTTSVSPGWKTTCRGPVETHGLHVFYLGGCGNAYPPKNNPPPQSNEGVAWLEMLFGIPKAFANRSPLDTYLSKNGSYKVKTEFSKNVEDLLGARVNPAVVTGDFNGDGVEDTVAILIKNNKHRMVFFNSEGGTYKVDQREIIDFNEIYLTKVSKEKVKSGLPNSRARDLVQLEIYLGHTEAYFVENNRVTQFRGELRN